MKPYWWNQAPALVVCTKSSMPAPICEHLKASTDNQVLTHYGRMTKCLVCGEEHLTLDLFKAGVVIR